MLTKALKLLIVFLPVFIVLSFTLPTPAWADGDQLIITEVLSRPTDGSANEFIEIYNAGAVPADLFGWQIDDIEGGSSPYKIKKAAKILPGQYLTFYNKETKLALNDSGDSARLIDPESQIKAEISFGRSQKGQSYAQLNDQWFWTGLPTPGQKNIRQDSSGLLVNLVLTENSSFNPDNIRAARELADGQSVTVSGQVTAVPGLLSAQYFYLQDESGGLQIYAYDKDFPDLESGERITVSGELSTSNGERRLKISQPEDIEIIGRAELQSQALTIDGIDAKTEGCYIKTKGTVTTILGNTFVMHGSGEIKVILKESAGFSESEITKDDRVEISGIVANYRGQYRILPFRAEDVRIIPSDPITGEVLLSQVSQTKGNLPATGSNHFLLFILASLAALIWNTLAAPNRKHRL